MRRVWITRRKAAAAGQVKMKIYMEDPENGSIEINGCLCRMLGELKNNQKRNFEIGYDETKLFVMAGRPNRKRSYRFLEIPEGKDDIILTGRNYFEPFAGNPFRFDGVTEEEPAGKKRKSGGRKSKAQDGEPKKKPSRKNRKAAANVEAAAEDTPKKKLGRKNRKAAANVEAAAEDAPKKKPGRKNRKAVANVEAAAEDTPKKKLGRKNRKAAANVEAAAEGTPKKKLGRKNRKAAAGVDAAAEGTPKKKLGRKNRKAVPTMEAIPETAPEKKPGSRKRKSGRRNGSFLLVVFMLLCILAGILGGNIVSDILLGSLSEPEEEPAFEVQGLRIDLPREFLPAEAEGYTACYSAGDVAVFMLREDFTAMEGFAEMSLADYGNLILSNNGLAGAVEPKEEAGLTTFEWIAEDTQTGSEFYYCCGLYKGQDAFWMVQITTSAENAARKSAQFRQWLQSVSVS